MPAESVATSQMAPQAAAQERSSAPARRRWAQFLFLPVIALSGVYAAGYLWFWLPDFAGDNDFFVFRSAAQWVDAFGQDPGLYNLEKLRIFQQDLLGYAGSYHPFPYPPSFLMFVLPLTLVPESWAFGVFVAVTLTFMLALVAWRRPGLAVTLLVSPATLLSGVIGQVSLLTTGLLAGGLKLVNSHPWWAGTLLGLLSFKPQLGLLVPVVLIAVGAWRAFAAAALVTVLLPLPSLILGGWPLWETWFKFLPVFSAQTALNIDSNTRLMISPPGALVAAGVPLTVASALQIPITLSVALVVYRACRRYGLSELSVAMVCVASLLATPYAYFYDLMLATFAAVVLAEAGFRTGFRPWEGLTIALAWLLPLFASHELCPAGAATVSLLFLMVVLLRRLADEPPPGGGTSDLDSH